jgi:parallel beta-helix repeat protein
MVLDAVSNFVRGETAAAVDSTQTTVSVVDASIFPDPAVDGEYNVVIWDASTFPRPDQDGDVEVLRVTAIDTGANTLTVVRGQEGTSGVSHPTESAVHLSPTAKMFSDIESTFADFWDSSAQELTADVNNTAVNTDEIENTEHVGADDDLAQRITDVGGDTEYVVHGSHTLASITQTVSNIVIRGREDATINWDTNSSDYLFDLTGDGIEIRDLKIDMKQDDGGIRIAGNGVRIVNNEFVDFNNRPAVRISDGSGATRTDWVIEDNEFSGQQQAIIFDDQTNNVRLRENDFFGGTASVAIDSASALIYNRLKIQSNHFEDRDSNLQGIVLNGTCNHINISNNTFEGVQNYAIYCTPFDGVIEGNSGTLKSGAFNVTSGIYLIGGRDTSVTGNSFEDGDEVGIYVKLNDDTGYQSADAAKHSIVGNDISGFAEDGIRLEGAHKCTLTGNNANNNSQGNAGTYSGIALATITINTTDYGTTNCTVVGNSCGDTGGDRQNYGVEETGQSNANRIADNQVAENVTGGVSTVGAATTTNGNITTLG